MTLRFWPQGGIQHIGGGSRGAISVSGGGITYLLRDLFPTDTAAPLTSPRTCEPGPGTLTLTQTDGQFSISSGALVVPAQTTPTQGDLGFVDATTRTRVAGLSTILTVNSSAYGGLAAWCGWFSTVGIALGHTLDCWTVSSTGGAHSTGAVLANELFTPLVNVPYTLETVLRTAGAFFLLRGGIHAGRLMWVDASNSGASVKAGFSNTANVCTLDNVSVLQRGGNFLAQNALADAFVATPSDNEVITTRADTLIEFTWTAATNETLNLMFRRVDDDNCWIFRADQAGSTVKLFKKIGGIETEVKTAAATWTNGVSYRIVVICVGQSIERYIGATHLSVSGVVGAEFMNATTAKVSGFTTGANFAAWPAFVNPDTGAGVKPDLLVFDGNSLTAPTAVTINYPDRLMSKIPGYAVRCNFGVGGQTWANMSSDAATQVDALYSATAHTRNIVICWEFSNDAANALVNATTYINARVAAGWKVVVLTALPFGDGSTEATRTAFNAGIRALASANVIVADVAADSRIGDAGDQNDTNYYNADKVHLLDAGYEVVAGIVANVLLSV